MKPKLFLDEDIYPGLAAELRRRNIDAVGVGECQRRGMDDADQLAYAVAHGRVMVTFNRDDFQNLAEEYFFQSMGHRGIVISPQYAVGELLRRLLRLCMMYTSEELANQVVFLQTIDE